ncbi:hypothetical protein ABMC30_13475 [Comamonas kerstersii]|jgi:hypothetical protein|nr:hypothetical protein [Comamonas kerstersii]
MDRCWLKGQMGDAIHAVLCAAGYNLRWLMRAVVRLGLKGFFARFFISAFLTWLSAAPTGQRKAVDGLKLNFAGPAIYATTPKKPDPEHEKRRAHLSRRPSFWDRLALG